MTKKKKILVVGEEGNIAYHLSKANVVFDYSVIRLNELKTKTQFLSDNQPNLIIFSFSEDESDKDELLAFIQNENISCPFIIISGNFGEQTIIDMMKTGARDVILWSNIKDLPKTINYLMKEISHFEKTINTEVPLDDELFHVVVNSIPDGIVVKSISDNKYEYMNQSFILSMGFKNDNKSSDIILQKMSDKQLKFINKNDDKLVSDDKGLISYEDKIEVCNREKWFNIQKMILTDSNYNSKKILSIFVDITNHKVKEQELRKSVNRFSKLFSNSPYPISIVRSSDGKIMDLNDSYLSLLGLTYDETVGKTSEELGIWEDSKQINRLFENARNNEKVKNQEVKVNTKDGDIKTLLMSIEQITSEEDEKLLIFMALDITDRKTFIEEIRRSLAKEKDLNILKTRFISMISHEFRTPLTAIMLSTDLLKRYGDQWKDEDKMKHFDRIQKTVLRMTQLMESVLTIGRMEAGKFDFQPESIDLNSYCKSLAESIEFTSSGKVRIFYSYTGNCVDPLIDENLIGLILSNLLNNAVKYSQRGKNIQFDVLCNADTAEFTIKDKGIGIPEKDQKNLFNTFYRASNVGSISGYGLGLNIVKKCVEAHKGEINVESREKEGTTFIVKIPTS